MSAVATLVASHRKLLLIAVTALYLLVLFGNLVTRAPWVDEAYAANPAWNLANTGSIGTTCIEMQGSGWTHIDRYTYNTFPVGIAAMASFYKILGFSLTATRLPSLFCAFALLFSVYSLLLSLGASRVLAITTLILLAADYNFMIAATFGRLDMICAALGFGALAVYCACRPSRPALAVLASCSLATLSLFTHPNGIVFLPALFILELLAFRERLPWKVALLAIVPFAVGAGCWLLYVSLDSQAALDQLRSNAPGRLTGFLHPFRSILDELTGRYLTSYGLTLGEHPPGPVRARGLVLLAYWGATALVLFIRELRNTRYTKVMLALLGLTTIYFTFFEGTRFSYYIVLVTPYYAFLLATSLTYFWTHHKRLVVISATFLILLQVAGVVYRSAQNPMRNSYLPAVAFLKGLASPNDLVLAGCDFGFEYGYNRNAKEEISLGYRSGADPEFIVVDQNMTTNMASWKTREPAIYAYMTRKLAFYFKIYDSAGYRIYRRP